MSKTKKTILIGLLIIIVGAVIFIGAFAALGFDFNKLSTVKYQTNTHDITENFKNISIDTPSSDVTIVFTEDGGCKAVCYEDEKYNNSVEVQSDTLVIKTPDKIWYDNIGNISFDNAEITLYLPAKEYGSLNVNASSGEINVSGALSFESVKLTGNSSDINCSGITVSAVEITVSSGDIKVSDLTAGTMKLSAVSGNIEVNSTDAEGVAEIKATSGDVKIADTQCNGLIAETSSGDIKLTNVIAVNNFSLQSNSGDVNFDRCDAGEISMKTDSGDVKGTLLSEKVFVYKTSSGKVNLPGTVTGGKCSIETGSGDINIEIAER